MDKETLIQELVKARDSINELVLQAERSKHIYPEWTVKELLDHMTGWDDAIIATLNAHMNGMEPGIPAQRGVDPYNAETVETRESLDYDASYREWQQTRQILIDTLSKVSDEKYNQRVIIPWGGEASVSRLIEVFIHHETEEHGNDLRKWLENPDMPLSTG